MNVTGSGVLIFEVVSKKEINLLLVSEVKTDKFTEPGGRRDVGKNIVETARDELYEETAGYVWFNNPNLISQGGNWVVVNQYRAYIILVNEINIDQLHYNIDVIQANPDEFRKSFREIHGATKVSLHTIYDAIASESKIVTDIFGNDIKLKKRTYNVLLDFFNNSDLYKKIFQFSPVINNIITHHPEDNDDNELYQIIFS